MKSKTRDLDDKEPEQPDSDSIIWRYMDFAKFYSVVSASAIYLPSISALKAIDPFEGAVGAGIDEENSKICYEVENFLNVDAGLSKHLSAEKFLRLVDAESKINFASCWCELPHESDAMWKLYLKNPEQGVAIKTRYSALFGLADANSKDFKIGRISYEDYSGWKEIEKVFFTKRKAFTHENEVRLVVRDNGSSNVGLDMPI